MVVGTDGYFQVITSKLDKMRMQWYNWWRPPSVSSPQALDSDFDATCCTFLSCLAGFGAIVEKQNLPFTNICPTFCPSSATTYWEEWSGAESRAGNVSISSSSPLLLQALSACHASLTAFVCWCERKEQKQASRWVSERVVDKVLNCKSIIINWRNSCSPTSRKRKKLKRH